MNDPLLPVVSAWLNKINLARDHKRTNFQDDADEAMAFFDGPYDFLYGMRSRAVNTGFVYSGDDSSIPRPTFAVTVNKVAEMVQLFGPFLYHKNPNRQVNPRKFPGVNPEVYGQQQLMMDPNLQMQLQQQQQHVQQERGVDTARAKLIESYLNYTPTALGLRGHSRAAIDEAIIKGMGVLWTELYTPEAMPQQRMVGSFFDSVDRLFIDPDPECMEEAKWIARECTEPVWKVEQDYGLPRGALKGNLEQYNQQSVTGGQTDKDYMRKIGLTNDLVKYYKIYSKMGLGGRLSGVPPGLRDTLDPYGEWTYLVVCDTMPYPLNLPSDWINTQATDQDIQQRTEWPTPFWADNAWPFTPFIFHRKPRAIWPISHLKPGMGELKFINWATSFLMGKIRTATRDFLVVLKSASEELKDIILHGKDYTLIQLEKTYAGTIQEVVQFLQHPAFHGDIWKVIDAVMGMFEKRVGLTEIMYGMSQSSYRSAEEANIKGQQTTLRPDDMAECVEEAMTQVSRKEALAARWHLGPQDVQPVLGDVGAYWWQQIVTPQDPISLLHQNEYRIEAGSTKKPNRARDAANMQTVMQVIFPPIWGLAMQTLDFSTVNNILADWAKTLDLDPERYLIHPPPPPPVPAPGAPTGGGGPLPGQPPPPGPSPQRSGIAPPVQTPQPGQPAHGQLGHQHPATAVPNGRS